MVESRGHHQQTIAARGGRRLVGGRGDGYPADVPSPVMKTETLPVRADGSLRLAIVADSHSAPHRATAPLIAARRPDAILHAGDIGDLGVLEALATVAPVHAVRGNIDVR